jgi:predicted nucleic acid-binding protein
MQNPFEIRRKSIIAWKELASDIVNASEEILTYAEKLICEKIKVKDALHIACAVYAKCQYFITTDKRLLNFKSDDILIVNPIEFINEME